MEDTDIKGTIAKMAQAHQDKTAAAALKLRTYIAAMTPTLKNLAVERIQKSGIPTYFQETGLLLQKRVDQSLYLMPNGSLQELTPQGGNNAWRLDPISDADAAAKYDADECADKLFNRLKTGLEKLKGGDERYQAQLAELKTLIEAAEKSAAPAGADGAREAAFRTIVSAFEGGNKLGI